MATSGASGPLALPAENLDEVFPFHVAFGSDWRIVQRGPSLARLSKAASPGALFNEVFSPGRPEAPFHFATFREARRTLYFIHERSTHLTLRGQMMYLPERNLVIFLGSPWLVEASSLSTFGLSFDDFAVHDSVVDLLHVLQSQRMAVADLKKLAQKLHDQRASLRAANERLLAHEQELQKLALIAQRTDNAVVLSDATGRIEWVNDGFVRLTGYTFEEARGRRPGDFLQGPRTNPDTVAFMRERLMRSEGFSAEVVNYSKSGREYWIAIEVQPIRDESGQVTNFMAVEADVTARKENERRMGMQYQASQILAEGGAIEQVLRRILESVCHHLDWRAAFAWQVGEGTDRLVCTEIWCQSPLEPGALRAACEEPRTDGTPRFATEVWHGARPAWTRDAPILRRIVDPATGKPACHLVFGLPILVNNAAWGVLEFLSQGADAPDSNLLKSLSILGGQIGLYIRRQNSEARLRQANALQRAILASANYSIVATAPDGIIRTFTAGAERLLGYRADEVVGCAKPDLFHDPDEIATRARELSEELGRPIEPGFEVFIARARQGACDEREWTYVRRDGSRVAVHLSVTALFDDDRQVAGYLGIASDITVRKQAERALIEARNRSQQYFELAGTILLVLGRDGTVTQINNKGYVILGADRDSVLGENWFDTHVADEDRETERERHRNLILGRALAADQHEYEIRRRDGTRRRIAWHDTVLRDDAGRIVGTLSSGEDVTELREALTQLRIAKEAAEEASQAKSDFLATISHEIRTPMNGVMGMADLLSQTPLTPRQRELAGAVSTSADALLQVINDVLDFSKIEAGKLEISTERFRLRDMLDSVLEVASHRDPAKDLTLSSALDRDTPDELLGDALRLRQVLLNLVGNGVKFTDRGQVRIRVRHLGSAAERVRLRFEVHDTGIGLDESQIKRLFQPFVQTDSSAARRFAGSGLGLAISRRLVELMAGSIGVSSQPGLGSTFWFEVSLGRPAGTQPPLAASIPESAGALVLARSPHVREAISEQLRCLGVSVEAPADPAGFPACLASLTTAPNPLRYVIIDEPDFGAVGESVEASLSTLTPPPRIAVIAKPATALASESDRSRPFPYVLTKPIKHSALVEWLVGTPSPATPETTSPTVDPQRIATVPAQLPGLGATRILLAEDNPINRRYCLLVLESLGGRADVAQNGLEAIESIRKRPYDLILMDCNMPEMDGYEATQAIRKLESAGGTACPRRLRIIALTANAVVGERERCLGMGMDDFLSKPFTSPQLRETLQRNLATDALGPDPAGAHQTGTTPASEPLNIGRLEQLCDELDRESVRELVHDFIRELPTRREELLQLHRTGPVAVLRRAAHSLKGASASMGLDALAEHCFGIESATDRGDQETIDRLIPLTPPIIDDAEASLRSWLAA